MNVTLRAFGFLIVSTFGILLAGCQSPPKAPPPVTWEYKQVNGPQSDQQLNDYARQGWTVDQVSKALRSDNHEWHYFLLKRPRQ